MLDLRKLPGFNLLDLLSGNSSRIESSTKSNYRIAILLHSLNKVLRKKVVEGTEDLESLVLDAGSGILLLSGHYCIKGLTWSRLLRTDYVKFKLSLRPVRVEGNRVIFRIESFRLYDHNPRSFDPIRFFSKVFKFHRRLILEQIVEEVPEILSLTEIGNEVRIDLNYFLAEIPEVAGKVSIQKVIPEKGNVFLFVRSNTILKPLLDFFGPDYLRIEPISENEDSLLMLWRD
ncbi:hypothetical protein LEP1GSC058_3062 [Leptospira fainei serovar Hurstbridge str. BUT 6]|uniref:Uncharacterized protein n=1 Tax=Leptospira fainei serovar Hurstbridge str. BUT 6 TaxID=1193011 RepID=S3VAF4_9LEPT|nr:hypothetical protein [Leptospira fainei]EPG73435.1 hypothetical protein LEP1GSC058_3062 [Leptospira fainei serovar Hurstbridge str. BUT 6]